MVEKGGDADSLVNNDNERSVSIDIPVKQQLHILYNNNNS